MSILKKVVVTGGAGFIGSNLARALVEKGCEVQVVDNFVAGNFDERVVPGAVYNNIDIKNTAELVPIFEGADAVFHLAALPKVQDSIEHPIETSNTNVDGTLSVLEAARAAGVQKVVFSSSAAVYGDQETMPVSEAMPAHPLNPYGLHKYIGENTCVLWSELYSLPTVSLRYFNVYGPGFDPNGAYASVVGRFIDLRQNGKPLTIVGDGTNTRDYVHVDDVVRANILAAESDGVGKGEVINIGSGQETSVTQLAAMIGGPVESVESRQETSRSVSDISRARALLGFEPTVEIEIGIENLKKLHGIS